MRIGCTTGGRIAGGALLAAALMIAPVATALTTDYGVGAEIAYTDNVDRIARSARDEWLASGWLDFTLSEAAAAWEGQVYSRLAFRDYLNGTYSPELRLHLESSADVSLVPQLLRWHVSDYFRQLRMDTTSPLTPGNSQDTNAFWTGPDLLLRPSAVDDVILGARFGDFYYEEESLDSTRYLGFGRWLRRLSPLTDISLNIEASSVFFDDERLGPSAANIDFDRGDIFLRLQRRLRLSNLRIDLGASVIDRYGLRSMDGLLAALEWERRLARNSLFGVSISHHYTDSGTRLLEGTTGPAAASLDTTVSDDILYEKRSEIFYRTERGVLSAAANIFFRDEDFEIAPMDRDISGLALNMGYALTSTSSAGFFVDVRRLDYSQMNRQDDDYDAGLRFQHWLSRRTTLDLTLRRLERDSTLVGADFEENVISLLIQYGFRRLER